MMRLPYLHRNQQGFTLIEVIVTIMAAGILAAFFVHFMGTSLSSASKSVTRVQAESAGEATVERIIADYVVAMNANDPTGALGAIETKILNDDYDNPAPRVKVERQNIEFNAGGNVVDRTPTATNTLKVTVQVEGNNYVFLLTQSRTAIGQPKIYY